MLLYLRLHRIIKRHCNKGKLRRRREDLPSNLARAAGAHIVLSASPVAFLLAKMDLVLIQEPGSSVN